MIPEQLEKDWHYDFQYWVQRMESDPIELVRDGDYSQSYESDRCHVFKLENGKYVVVTECGCSCYDSEDADIDLFPDEKSAIEQFEKWERESKRYWRYWS